MHAADNDINILLKVQDADLAALKAKRDLEQLPQRAVILQEREKQAALAEKRTKIAAMKTDLDQKLTRIMVEDELLAQKEKDAQAAIEASGSNFRDLEAHTKELASLGDQRLALAEELEQLEPQVTKVSTLLGQVDQLSAASKAAEEAAIADFRQEGGALQNLIAELTRARQQLIQAADPELAKTYEQIASGSGGVAIGLRNGDRCGICRTQFDTSRLLDLKAQAPLVLCPHCKRLLVV